MMKRRVFGMLLSLCLVLALIPAAAFAEDAVKTFTLEAPYTTKVEQGGSAKPGKTVFKLEVVSFDGKEPELDGVTVSGSTITTDGVGDYNNKLTFTFSDESFYKISDGVFVQQVNEGADGWTYDPTVWYLGPHIAGAELSDDEVPELVPGAYELSIFPAYKKGTEYDYDWDAAPLNQMTFKNTYTKTATEVTPDPDETGSNADVSALPKTGDSSSLTGWLILLAVAAAAMAGVVVHGRRRKNAREE